MSSAELQQHPAKSCFDLFLYQSFVVLSTYLEDKPMSPTIVAHLGQYGKSCRLIYQIKPFILIWPDGLIIWLLLRLSTN